MFRMPAPTTFTYINPTISINSTNIRFSSKCDEQQTFILKSRILTVDRASNEILIFLTDNQIVQLIDCPQETYSLIVDSL